MSQTLDQAYTYLGRYKAPKTYRDIVSATGVNENTLRKELGGLTWRKRLGAYKATGEPIWRQKNGAVWEYWTE